MRCVMSRHTSRWSSPSWLHLQPGWWAPGPAQGAGREGGVRNGATFTRAVHPAVQACSPAAARRLSHLTASAQSSPLSSPASTSNQHPGSLRPRASPTHARQVPNVQAPCQLLLPLTGRSSRSAQRAAPPRRARCARGAAPPPSWASPAPCRCGKRAAPPGPFMAGVEGGEGEGVNAVKRKHRPGVQAPARWPPPPSCLWPVTCEPAQPWPQAQARVTIFLAAPCCRVWARPGRPQPALACACAGLTHRLLRALASHTSLPTPQRSGPSMPV